MRRAAIIVCVALAVAGCGDGKCEDADGDGYCAEPNPMCEYSPSSGVAYCYTPAADCDDNDPTIRPYATEIPNDGIDQDCNGSDATELCDGITDADLDGLVGCADPACTEKCDETRAALCASTAPTPVMNASVNFLGTLWPGLDTMQPSCFGGRGPEQVFHLVPGKPGEVGALQLTISPGTYGFSIRTACDDDASEIACFAPTAAPEQTLVVNGGEPLDLIVDTEEPLSVSMSFGIYAAFRPAVCGDGVRVLPEECDDGGAADGDGCSATCAFEPAFWCAAATPITAGYTVVELAPDAPNGFAGSCSGEGAPARVLVFTPAADGQVAVGVASGVAIYARSSCEDAATELGCATPTTAGVTTLTVPAKTGEPIFFFVDGVHSSFALTTVFFPAN